MVNMQRTEDDFIPFFPHFRYQRLSGVHNAREPNTADHEVAIFLLGVQYHSPNFDILVRTKALQHVLACDTKEAKAWGSLLSTHRNNLGVWEMRYHAEWVYQILLLQQTLGESGASEILFSRL